MTISFHKKGNNTPKVETKSTAPSNQSSGNNQDSYLNGIGSYEFIKPLGSGKFSKVMLAYHLETHQQVAIKVSLFYKEVYDCCIFNTDTSKDYR